MKYFLVFLLVLVSLVSLNFLVLDQEVKTNQDLDEIYLRPKSSNGLVVESQYPYVARTLQENTDFDLEVTSFSRKSPHGIVTECSYPYTGF